MEEDNCMEVDRNYQEALDYLYSYVDYSLTRTMRYAAENFNLDRVNALLHLLGAPQLKYPVIHVAGTKGKGSTSAMMASALKAAGYKVGFYTSPHLADYCERIQINGVSISHERLVAMVEEIKPFVDQVEKLTTFEITTALGFWYYAQEGVDVAVVEVGLGGRLDATNVVWPLVSVITSLSMDHMDVLGDTLAKIAIEKAGIIKEGRPIVLSPQREEARLAVTRVAEERHAPMTLVGQDYLFAPWAHSLSGQSLLVWPAADQPLVDQFIESAGRENWEPLRLTLPLLGHHQVENAATAYAALQVARAEGLNISDASIIEGFSKVNWPGRFEVLRRSPLFIVDSAHNRNSALKLRQAIDDYLPGQPVILIFGASEDKDVKGMFAELLPRVRQVIATESVHPRAMKAEELVGLAHRFGCPAQKIVPVEAAVEHALNLAGDEFAIVAAGSLFVAAAVREIWGSRVPA
jgi:dihydrofolate synthase/folylpolyglutamate synthase